ncbi:DUF3592 domain-containing protein [Enterocloster citroniae]
MDPQHILLLIAFVYLLIGLIFICVSIVVSKSIQRKKSVCTQNVQAKVIDITRETLNRGNHTSSWYPVYEYWTGNQKIQKKSHIGGIKNTFKIGQDVNLLINPKNPEEFYNPTDQAGTLKKVFLVVGLILVCCSIGFVVASKIIL